MALFEFADGAGVTQGQADIVEPVHQAIFTEGVDLEGVRDAAIRGGDALLLKVPGRAPTEKQTNLMIGRS